MAFVLLFFIMMPHQLYSDTIYCRNYKECSDVKSLQASDEVICSASFSCEGTDSISVGIGSNDIECTGVNACSNVKSIISLKQYCRAPFSCSNSTFENTQNVYCQGASSCTNAIFNNVFGIDAYGELSLMNSTITAIDDNMRIQLRGHFAGYGAKIECIGSSTCNIYCYSTGCVGLSTTGDGTINFVHASNDTLRLNAVVDINSVSIRKTAECTQNYDAFREMAQRHNISATTANGTICARGASSSFGVDYLAIVNNTLICSGASACRDIDVIAGNYADVYCSAWSACSHSLMKTDGNIICDANDGCQDSNIITSGNIYCSARQVKTLFTEYSGCLSK